MHNVISFSSAPLSLHLITRLLWQQLASLTKATDGVGIGLSLQLYGGLLWMTLLMVTQPITLDSHRIWGGLPACRNGGAVKRLELKNRG